MEYSAESGTFAITDDGSMNGVFVNRTKIAQVAETKRGSAACLRTPAPSRQSRGAERRGARAAHAHPP